MRIQQLKLKRLQKMVQGFLSAEINVEFADIYFVRIPIWYMHIVFENENILLLLDGYTCASMEEVKT